jgi:hypothetical protein
METNNQKKKERTICPMPLVFSIVTGLGFGILTGEYLACLVIGLGIGGVILGVTQKDALLKKKND